MKTLKQTLIIAAAIIPTIVLAPYTALIFSEPTIVKFANHINHINPQEEQCLATMVYGEARGESETGMIAVAYSAINRVQASNGKKSLCDVVLAPKQYSVFNYNAAFKELASRIESRPSTNNSLEQDAWKRAHKVTHLVMTKAVKDPTMGATHYLAPIVMKSKKYHTPKWAKEYKLVMTIDNHLFYKRV
jgi:N-acetylmuramoyl-L-alanine amidase